LAAKIEIIRDPVHGFIKLSDVERDLINTAPFQRLRRIKQLAMTNYVYPGAEHTRFSHSLGVMQFAADIFDTLCAKDEKLIKSALDAGTREELDVYRQKLRLAALLHDVGHAPFSHASEEILPDGMSHEQQTLQIIRSSHIADVINAHHGTTGVEAKQIAQFFDEKTIDRKIVFLKPIIDGELDADKMDYLLRDSLFTGVHYGKFDNERLVASLCVLESPEQKGGIEIGIEEGGVHALEALVLARYFMFTQVYFHRVRRAYDMHLVGFLKDMKIKYPAEVNKYLEWDDRKVIDLASQQSNNTHAKAIRERKHFKEAFQTQDHIDADQRRSFQWLKSEVSKEFDCTKLFFDEAKKASHKFSRINFFVRKKSGDMRKIEDVSQIVATLKPIEQCRIYADQEIRSELANFCEEFCESKEMHF